MIFLTPSLVELEVRYYSGAPFQCLFIMDFQVVTGKQLIFGFNAKGKPAFYNRPRSSNSVYRLVVRACNEPYGARRRVSRSLAITLKHPLTSTRTIVLLINLADIEGNILLSRKSNNFFFSPRSPSQKAGTCHIHQCPFHRHYLEDHHAIYRSHNS